MLEAGRLVHVCRHDEKHDVRDALARRYPSALDRAKRRVHGGRQRKRGVYDARYRLDAGSAAGRADPAGYWNGAQSFETGDGEPARPCAMEYVYYARPDSMLENRNVHAVREDCGILLAEEETVDADIVVGVPDTAMSAAAAFARALNKPYEIGLIKNRYIGSTYIRPSAQQREQGIRTRLNAISSIVRGKRVYLVDDSLVKGFTAKRLCQLMKEAGASEVHLRIASPRIAHPCVYGYEEARAGQLAAARYTDEEMCQLFGADSIRFLDEDAFRLCVGPASCMACMNGRYVDVDPKMGGNKNGRKI